MKSVGAGLCVCPKQQHRHPACEIKIKASAFHIIMWHETSKTSKQKKGYYQGPDYPISEPQRRAIFGIAGEVGMDDETRHDFVFMVTGKRSTKDLLFREAKKVIKELKRQFPKLVKLKKKPKHKPTDILTEAQNELILKLCQQLGKEPYSEYIRGVFYQSFGKFYPQTVEEGSDAIEALKDIIEREQIKCPPILP